MTHIIRVAIADDSQLFRKGIISLIHSFKNIRVDYEAANGKNLLEMVDNENIPDIFILDIHWPIDCFHKVISHIKSKWNIPILVLSAHDHEYTISMLLKNGVNGYISKDVSASILIEAIQSIYANGYYHSELANNRIINMLYKSQKWDFALTEKEIVFLSMCCGDLTYDMIAQEMCLSVRTIDGYRDTLFKKLNIKSRTGLAMFAIRSGITNVRLHTCTELVIA